MKKILSVILSSLFLSIIFSGCFSPIFYEINNDVAPEDSTVSGRLLSVVRYTVNNQEFLVTVSNGGIKYKPVDINSNTYNKHGCWKTFDCLPENYEAHHYDYYGTENHVGEQMLKIISDSTNLYLITCEYKNDVIEGSSAPSKIHLYTTAVTDFTEDEKNGIVWNNSEWTTLTLSGKEEDEGNELKVFIPENSDYYFSAFNIFCTNSVQKDHRYAYVRQGGTSVYSSITTEEQKTYASPVYYQLNGAKTPDPITVDIFDTEVSEDYRNYYGCNSAVWINNEVKFFSSMASVTNETYANNPTSLYYGVGNTLYYALLSDNLEHKTDGLTTGSSSVSISCLATCADCLLIGRASYSSSSSSATGGIAKTTLDENGIPGSSLTSFTTNAEIKLKSAYFIMTLIVEDPAKNELDSNIFSSVCFLGTGSSNSASFDNVGLWSYYPDRGNWNLE